MKKNMLACLLCAVLLFCTALTGCGNTPQKTVDNDEFLLGSWVAYTNNEDGMSMEDQTKRLADAGLNFIMYGSWIPDTGAPLERDLQSLDWWKYVDKVMKNNNMKYMFSASGNGGNNVDNTDGSLDNLLPPAVASAKKIVPYLENCIGYMVKDEPTALQFDELSAAALGYAAIKEGAYPFVNMNPSSVGTMFGWEILGGSYYDYFDSWVKTINAENMEYLSHDHYPFNRIGTDFTLFNDMETMRQVGLKYDLKTHGFPQSCAWQGKRMPTVDEIRWNVYAYLAYGFKALTYFNYVMWQGESCFDGLINLSDEITNQKLYDDVAALNWDLRRTSDIIMNVDCLHAYHTANNIASVTGLPDVELLPADFMVTPDTDSDLIISVMRARDGSNPYLMIFNKSFENEVVDMSFTVDQTSGITDLEVYDTWSKVYESLGAQDGNFTLSLKKGEGKYIRIQGDVEVA